MVSQATDRPAPDVPGNAPMVCPGAQGAIVDARSNRWPPRDAKRVAGSEQTRTLNLSVCFITIFSSVDRFCQHARERKHMLGRALSYRAAPPFPAPARHRNLRPIPVRNAGCAPQRRPAALRGSRDVLSPPHALVGRRLGAPQSGRPWTDRCRQPANIRRWDGLVGHVSADMTNARRPARPVSGVRPQAGKSIILLIAAT